MIVFLFCFRPSTSVSLLFMLSRPEKKGVSVLCFEGLCYCGVLGYILNLGLVITVRWGWSLSHRVLQWVPLPSISLELRVWIFI